MKSFVLGSVFETAGRGPFLLGALFGSFAFGVVAIDATWVPLTEAELLAGVLFVMKEAFGAGSLTTTFAAVVIGGGGLVTASTTGAGSATVGIEV